MQQGEMDSQADSKHIQKITPENYTFGSHHNMRIFLIGFMGSGKTYTGKRLAAALGYDFYDLDALVEEREGCSVAHVFEQKGETYFRELERQTLHETSKWERAVISCGGGTPCFFDNMDWMNAQGITIWLDPPMGLVLHRLQRKPHKRPLLGGLETEAQWAAFIEQKLTERRPYYERAQAVYRQPDEDADTAAALMEILSRAEYFL